MKIYRAKEATTQLIEAFGRLLPQLSSSATTVTAEHLDNLLSSSNTHLLVAEIDGTIAAMLSLVMVDIPTGRKAWIEDVVVEDIFRGRNLGFELVEHAKNLATELGAKKIYLTSNPSRKAAHALYHKCGFEIYETTLFRLNLGAK